MKISYYSLGCKVNLYESVAIVNEFVDKGYELVDFGNESDVCLINTCSVTSMSDQKSRKIIRQAHKANPNGVICVMGCYSQLKPEEVETLDGVDLILGTTNRNNCFKLVSEKLEEKRNSKTEVSNLVIDFRDIKDYEELKISRFDNLSRGFVKIEDGCSNFCSYCTIPYARGRVRSRNKESVIEEIQTLTDTGLKEIVLTGINTGSYGLDLEDYSFAQLLDDVCNNVVGLGRLRISSIEATEINDDLLNVIKKHESHFCNHFHIPIQGGCDNTLKRMKRKYDIAYYKNKIAMIRNIFPDCNISCDIMAGFSGETNEDFSDTIKFVEEMNYGEMHVFPYSRRPKTVAYNYDGIVDDTTKKFRTNQLISLNNVKALDYRKQFKDSVLDVIVEKVNGNVAFGHSSNYLEIEFTGENLNVDDLVKVKLTDVGYPVSKGVVYNEI